MYYAADLVPMLKDAICTCRPVRGKRRTPQRHATRRAMAQVGLNDCTVPDRKEQESEKVTSVDLRSGSDGVHTTKPKGKPQVPHQCPGRRPLLAIAQTMWVSAPKDTCHGNMGIY